jgi:signal transduction histidine kinase
VAQQRNIAVDGSAVQTTLATADAASLARAVRNLLLNAIVYTRRNTTVRILAHADGPDAVIAVEDECGGIPVDHLDEVFTAGWHERAGRPGNAYSGAGVGLSLVSGIAGAHGGTVGVANVGNGCCFTLRIPGPAATAGRG